MPTTSPLDTEHRYRSGAAARLANISVNTLRIWERRYQVVAPPLTDSGHRLYSLLDVRRLTLLGELSRQGHAIGTIAHRSLADLATLAAVVPSQSPRASAPTPTPGVSAQVTVIGTGLAQRISAASFHRQGSPWAWQLAAVHDDLSSAAASSPDPALACAPGADTLLLIQLTSLLPDVVADILTLAREGSFKRVVVLYGFGPERCADALRNAGAHVRRGPLSDRELATLLPSAPAQAPVSASWSDPPPPSRRFDDRSLQALASMPSTVSCECPRHLAELVGQLAGFENYSAECNNRSAADAVLHAYLHQIAGSARAMLEEALAEVLVQEGIALPEHAA